MMGDKVINRTSTIPLSNSGIAPSIIRIVPNNCRKLVLAKKRVTKNSLDHVRTNSVELASSTTTSHTITAAGNSESNAQAIKYEACDDSSLNYSKVDCGNDVEFKATTSWKRRTDEDSIIIVPEKLSKTHSEQCCCSCRETLDLILEQQQQILKLLKNSHSIVQAENKFDLLPPMPFNDLNDFLDFDESLTNENVKSQFHAKLKKLLVSTEQKSISNIMGSIVTNGLCRNISWIGIKDTLAFGTTHMVNMIIDLVQEHHEIDIDVVKSRIAEWLRRCGDRINNEVRKNIKRASLGY